MNFKRFKLLAAVYCVLTFALVFPCMSGPGAFFSISNFLFSCVQGLTVVAIPGFIPGVYLLIYHFYKKRKNPECRLHNGVLLLVFVPVMLIFDFYLIVEPLRIHAREQAIYNAESLIQAVEKYMAANGHFPDSIEYMVPSILKKIPEPGIMGIDCYHYEYQKDSYILYFNMNMTLSLNYEVVMYSPVDRYQTRGKRPELCLTGFNHWKFYVYER